MLRRHAICSSFLLLILSLTTALAQTEVAKSNISSAVTITASGSGERVRFTAPSSVVQIRLEVYNSVGRKLLDNDVRGGNVFDWHLLDGQADHVADGSYLCVVTAKSLSGRITQKLGTVMIEKGAVSVRPTDPTQMTAQQTEVIGPVEENAVLTILEEDQKQTTTVIAHNGEEGQITRGRGALSFRLGDFFRGKDTEQMRLTTEGNLGIGKTHPQARLDVDGLIRTNQGIVFADGTIQTTAAASASGGKAAGDVGVGDGKLFKETNEGTSSAKAGNGKKKVSLETQGDPPTQIVPDDLIINGNIIFTPALNRDITMQQNIGGIRIFAGPTLGTSPTSAAIQFFGNGYAGFPGQAYIDSGAHDSAAVIFRTAQTGAQIAERMRVTATGNVGIGTNSPGFPLTVNGVVHSSTGGFKFPDGTIQTTAVAASPGIPVGTIVAYAGTLASVPAGWLVCDGTPVSRTQKPVLFASIGIGWGSGDGSTTFNLPDLSGRFLRGVDKDGNGTPSATPRDPDRDARIAANPGGNTGNDVGSLQADAFASHTHSAQGNSPGFLIGCYSGIPQGCFGFQGSIGGGFAASPATASRGGSETRPKNAYVIWIIKAD